MSVSGTHICLEIYQTILTPTEINFLKKRQGHGIT
jgi:hypothetical protein